MFTHFALLILIVSSIEGSVPLGPQVQQESRSELSGHQTVEDEVHGAVGQGQHVHQLAQRVVTGDQEILAQDC